MGHPKGCLLAGMYSYTDWKDEKANALKNKAQSAPYLSKACDLGQHLGCARFGELNIQGEHVPVLQFISSYLMVLFLKNSLGKKNGIYYKDIYFSTYCFFLEKSRKCH